MSIGETVRDSQPTDTTVQSAARAPVRVRWAWAGALLGAWLATRMLFGLPAGELSFSTMLSASLEVAAWTVAAGALAAATAAVSGRQHAWVLGAGAAVAASTWQHRIPSDLSSSLLAAWAPRPLGGSVPSLSAHWAPSTLTLWSTGWAAFDLATVLVGAWLLNGALTSVEVTSKSVRNRHLVAALGMQAVITLMIASTSGLMAGTAANLGNATGFLLDNAPVLVPSLLLGVAVARGQLPRMALWLPVGAVILDAAAGLLGDRDPWSGVQRLNVQPGQIDGQSSDTHTILLLAVIALVAAATLGATTWFASTTASLERREGVALVVGLLANTVDALATGVGLATRHVTEANPLVRAGGLGVKWIVVSVLFLVLWRLRPTAVWVVTCAYVLVVAYHVFGIALLN